MMLLTIVVIFVLLFALNSSIYHLLLVPSCPVEKEIPCVVLSVRLHLPFQSEDDFSLDIEIDVPISMSPDTVDGDDELDLFLDPEDLELEAAAGFVEVDANTDEIEGLVLDPSDVELELDLVEGELHAPRLGNLSVPAIPVSESQVEEIRTVDVEDIEFLEVDDDDDGIEFLDVEDDAPASPPPAPAAPPPLSQASTAPSSNSRQTLARIAGGRLHEVEVALGHCIGPEEEDARVEHGEP